MNKKLLHLSRWLFTIITLLTFGIGQMWGANQTYSLVSDVSTLTSSDKVLIVGYNNASSNAKYYALKNNSVTTAANLAAVEVTFDNSGNIVADLETDYTWYFESTTGTKIDNVTYPTFYIKSTKSTAQSSLYLQNANNTKSTITSKSNTDGQNQWVVGYTGTNGTNSVTGLWNKTASRMLAVYNSDFRCYASSNFNNINGHNVTIYKKIVASTPTLNLTGSGAFGDVETSSTKDLQFTLTGSNLTANATVTVAGTGFSRVAPANGTLTQTSGSITGSNNITVRFAPTTTGSHNGTLTVTSSGATQQTINLSGTGTAPVVKHKAYFYNGTTLLNEGGTEFAEGAAVSYSGSTPESCDTGEGASTTFAGWATATWDGKVAKNAIVPSFYESTLPVMGNTDVTYYAVFCKGGALALATSIAANDIVYLATAANGEGVTGANDNGKDATTSTNVSEWMAFTIENGSANGTWKLKNGSSYVIATAKNFTLGASPNNLTFEQQESTGKYRMIYNDGSDDYALSHNSNNGNFWRFYKTSNTTNYAWFYVFKASAGTNYMTNCCTPLGSINGSFNLNQFLVHCCPLEL